MTPPGRRRRLRFGLGRASDTRRDVREEIELHLAHRVEQLVAQGMAPHEAWREARRLFGASHDALDAAHRRDRKVRLRNRLDALAHDLRYAVRGLRREPLFAAFIAATLALGIGGNAAMFGVVDRLLVRGPEHVRDADRLVRLYTRAVTPWAGERTWQSAGYVRYLVTREATHSFTNVAAYAVNEGTVGRGAEARPIGLGWVTADFFETVGVRPALGRFFTAEEDAPAAPRHVAVIGYGLWQRDYGGRPIDGQTLVMNGEVYDVVGVAPRGFTGVGLSRVDVWAPMSIRSAGVTPNWERSWDAQWLRVIARLRPGVTREQATGDATAAHRNTYTGNEQWMRDAQIVALPISSTSGGGEPAEARVARWLVGVSVVVLLIACANTVNLLLARAVRRRRELGVRVALGSGRARLVRLLLAEGMALAVAGGVAGLGVAYGVGSLVRRTLLPDIEWTSSPLGGRVVVMSVIVALATGLVVGLLPAWQASGRGLTAALRTGAREGGGRRSTVRGLLTVAQAALSAMLLVGAGLFVRSLWTIRDLELGLEPERVVVAAVPIPDEGPPRTAEEFDQRLSRQRALNRAALDRVRGLPGVEHASLVVGLAFTTAFTIELHVPGLDSIPTLPGGGPYVHAITADYFATVGGRILRGRGFNESDREGSEPVAIVSELMATTLWPGRDAIGQCLVLDEQATCSRVVGVAANAHRDGLREPPAMEFYVPYGQERGFGGTQLLVRPAGRAAAVYRPLREALRTVNPSADYIRITTLQESLDPQIRPWRLGATMFTLWGALALIVAAIGLYSVMSYVVAHRTHEFAVRMALGARPTDIVRLILAGGIGLATIGIVTGLVPAWLGARWLQPLLFETNASDPGVYATVAGLLLSVALAACVLPAIRANRVTPIAALKSD